MTVSPKELTVAYSLEIQAAPSDIWAFLASGEGMLAWSNHSESILMEPYVGGRYDERGSYQGSAYRMVGTVLVYEPERELAFTFRRVDPDGGGWPAETEVRFRLRPTPTGTLVELTHSGFERLSADRAQRAFEAFRSGWDGSLERLRDRVIGA